jgi:hypothetical protein
VDVGLYLGMLSGWARSGRASKKPNSKNCYLGPARLSGLIFLPKPDPSGQNIVGPSGRAFTNFTFFLPKPGPLLLSGHKFMPRPSPTACFGPTGWTIFGPGRAGLPMPSYTCRANGTAWSIDLTLFQIGERSHVVRFGKACLDGSICTYVYIRACRCSW